MDRRIPFAPCLIGLAASSNGRLYGYDVASDQLLAIDAGTAHATQLGPIGFDANFAQSFDCDQESGTCYLFAFNGPAFRAELWEVDLSTATTTYVDEIGGDDGAVVLPSGAVFGTIDTPCPLVVLDPTPPPYASVGSSYAHTIAVEGGVPPHTFTVSSGALPPGLLLGAATGLISGTPTTAGGYAFEVEAADAGCGVGRAPYEIAVCEPMSVFPGSPLPSGATGVLYDVTFTASGGSPPYGFFLNAGVQLPPGLALFADGRLSGTPTAPGVYTFDVGVDDRYGCSTREYYDLTIVSGSCTPLLLTPPALPGGTLGQPYAATIAASGGVPPYVFALTGGQLPQGITLSAAGALAGTPTQAGTFDLNVTATDGSGCTGTQLYALSIAEGCPSLVLLPVLLPPASEDVPYRAELVGIGGTPPYAFAITSGTLPAGLALAPATGLLTGRPSASGSATFTIETLDDGGCAGSRSYVLDVAPAAGYVLGEGLGQGNGNLVTAFTRAGIQAPVTFAAYASGQWGTVVASGEIDGTAHGEILTGPGPGAVFGPHVRAFAAESGAPVAKVSYYAYGTLKYGTNVAAEHLDADAFQEILTGAGPGEVFGPHVRGWSYDATAIAPIPGVSFFAYSTLRYGVNVEGGDVESDAFDEVLTGPGPGPTFGATIRGFDVDGGPASAIPAINYNAFGTTHGVAVAGADVDGDGYAEIGSAPGPGAANAATFAGHDFDGKVVGPLPGFAATPFTTMYGGRVGLGPLLADRGAELVAGAGRDPAADARVEAYDYEGGALSTLPGSGFVAFASSLHGVNVAVGATGHY